MTTWHQVRHGPRSSADVRRRCYQNLCQLRPEDALATRQPLSTIRRIVVCAQREDQYDHTIAEHTYRHDHAVMLYAPLRTHIHEDRAGAVWFSIDRPSTRFASFDDPRIAEVGVELDHKVADLLGGLGVDTSAVLRP